MDLSRGASLRSLRAHEPLPAGVVNQSPASHSIDGGVIAIAVGGVGFGVGFAR